jgi:excisionase family DNA binding protein
MTQRAEENHFVAPLALSPRDAARAAGIGLTKLFEEIAAGRLKTRKLGRRTLIRAEDLRAWLAGLPERSSAA